MSLPPRPSSNFADIVQSVNEQWQHATISIYSVVGSDLVPMLVDREARAKQARVSTENQASSGWATKRRYTFSFTPQSDDPVILKGMVIRVTAAERDTSLLQWAFQVLSQSGSSEIGIRFVETATELAVAPPVTP